MKQEYYLGLDVGTDSVGWAVTNKNYDLLKFKSEPMLGVQLFQKANLSDNRRTNRHTRRRLERRKQRILLLQELFADEMYKVDPNFFVRIKNMSLCKDDQIELQQKCGFFADKDYIDEDYFNEYPTIHHLILALMNEDKEFDIRLVYLALAWLVKHRGHFLSEVSKDNISNITNFDPVYSNFCKCFEDNDYSLPRGFENKNKVEEILRQNLSPTRKYDLYKKELLGNKKQAKDKDETMDSENFIKLLCGSTVKINSLFDKADFEGESVCLSSDDEVLAGILSKLIDSNSQVVQSAKAVYDWAMLTNILNGCECISEAKVKDYKQHGADLKWLKQVVKKYIPEKYKEIFKDKVSTDNYAAYAHFNSAKEPFFKKLTKLLDSITPDKSDSLLFEDNKARISSRSFLPKQVTSENRVIPYQLYWYELDCIIKKAEKYLPFLSKKDEDGLNVSDKIRSIFEYRIPYFVGPLNSNSQFSWIKRKSEGKIYPWNIEKLVDYDKSEDEFIKRMTGMCTYLPGEDVLPKNSLLYKRFIVLNEINNLKIDDKKISSNLKQEIYNELFKKYRKVTYEKIKSFLITKGEMTKDSKLSGIDEIHCDLKPYQDFARLMSNGILSEEDVENLILRLTVTTDKPRLVKTLKNKYPQLSEEDVKYISRLNYNDFGRLSKRLLSQVEGVCTETGEVTTIITALWETNNNLMELLSDKYTFKNEIDKIASDYYQSNPQTVEQRLDDMYLSNAVKRPIIRTLDIIKDVTKAMKNPPAKIFVEMPRGATAEQKNKRTVSRKEQILALYEKCKEDTTELQENLDKMGDTADSRLQSRSLFLYYMQLGKCMYTQEPINLSELSSKYNIEHIYPRSAVKDDSILNNLVLVKSEVNGEKSDIYPIKADIRKKMSGYWKMLKDNGLITEEKYKRLTRSHGFTTDEKWGFINRQLTETSQSAKALTILLKDLYPNTEIVYVKAGLVSEFRQEYDCLKSRCFNDLHHAKDAYLNIVVGNVYNSKFTKNWFMKHQDNYSIKIKTLFNNEQKCGDTVIWDGKDMKVKVINTLNNNHAHMTRYCYYKKSGQKGGFYAQNLSPHTKEGLYPRKKNLDPKKYGGYNVLTITGFMLVKYEIKKTNKKVKSDVLITPIPLVSVNELHNKDAGVYIKRVVEEFLNKKVDSISLPLGMRLLKIDTMFSVDGYRFCLSGVTESSIIVYSFMPFNAPKNWNNYLKALERLNEKFENNKDYIYNEEADKVSQTQNTNLYDLYIDKLQNTIYSKRPGNTNTINIIVNGREKFTQLEIKEQVSTLLAIHSIFGRLTGGCNLLNIGGKEHSAKATLNCKLSNWKKNYSDVRIIDSSPSGLWEKKSMNLLELL